MTNMKGRGPLVEDELKKPSPVPLHPARDQFVLDIMWVTKRTIVAGKNVECISRGGAGAQRKGTPTHGERGHECGATPDPRYATRG